MTVTRYGEKSNAVKNLQEKLMLLGYNVGKDGADGVFGRNTLNAVKNF
jgi:peptidoglycan hydrolase-like protein with peptidoglycan-binding domain